MQERKDGRRPETDQEDSYSRSRKLKIIYDNLNLDQPSLLLKGNHFIKIEIYWPKSYESSKCVERMQHAFSRHCVTRYYPSRS